jgi:methylenetetrahydrofolate dehydrogenase (NADP+)/methenyltetrahydrofolate cyclohydrolase
VLDGAALAGEIRDLLRPRIEAFRKTAGRPPRLGLLLVGTDPGSEIYVRNKIKDGQQLGLETDLRRLPDDASFAEALEIVRSFNESETYDGVLVQSPLPSGMGEDAPRLVFDAIDPSKDVDGLNPVNVGRLVQKRPSLAPCTPSGIIQLLDRSNIPIAGQRVVIIGRSDIVGKPMAVLLLHRNATVTICHSHTRNLPSISATADILVAAIGQAAFVTPEFVKPGATVIDVGMNSLTEQRMVERLFGMGSKKMVAFETHGSVLCGDVHPAVISSAGALTLVPGGVGPLTRAMLLVNTVRAAEKGLDSRR